MGLFSLLGGKKEKALQPGQLDEEIRIARERELEEVREAHAALDWPTIPKLNHVNLPGVECCLAETVPEERKDDIGQIIYEDDISIDELRELNDQELLFVLTTFDEFDREVPIPDYERNRRKVYNEIIRRVRDAEILYVIYDKSTGYPFIDHGYGLLYFGKEMAEEAAELYKKQYRQVMVKEIEVEPQQEEQGAARKGYFDFLYCIGLEDLIIDNGAYRVKFKRDEISAAPGEWNRVIKDAPVNPQLCFSMLDMLEERRWPVKYEKRDEILALKEKRMIGNLFNGKYIVPMQYEGHAEKTESGRVRMGKDTKFTFFMVKTADDKIFMPVFTDGFEFGKMKLGHEWNAAVFSFSDIARFIRDKDGVAINPAGHRIFMPKEQIIAIDSANRAYRETKAQQNRRADDDNAVKRAVNGAMAHMENN
ncbi:SseB family protein [Butyrivibrio sp. M55]|uniref:SseB family protein n=1 Tax=Butyrivibrio sp. M55 TaxID=1855323 RepID=UPI0008E796CF|nr:SseB family protein [Butyrivibrio sp. M55]SFU65683.1 SseB protein N-terminal domain-containing protein [Butyrivibrio sp. M55]